MSNAETPVEGPVEVESPVTQQGSTFAERKAAREKAAGKAVESSENKSVSSRATRKKS